MNDNSTGENKLNSTGALRLWIDLLILRRCANVIPKVQVTLLHIDQFTKLMEEGLDATTRKAAAIAFMKVEY